MKVRQQEVGASLGQTLCQRIGEPRFELWFQGKTKFTCDESGVTVGVPNLFLKDWLAKSFAADVEAAALQLFEKPTPVRFAIDPELFQEARRREGSAESAPEPKAERHKKQQIGAPQVETPPARPRVKGRSKRYRQLSDFIVGPCNRVAHAAAVSLVEHPHEAPSPLVIHGSVGLGKSHLLEGICAGLRQSQPEARILFVTAEDFTNRFVQAVRFGKLGSLRKQFRECDALLVDDLHFLSKKPATQEEFLHTLDVLTREGRPVVVTCDCHPRLADQFVPELTDRLLGGSIWGLLSPDAETRADLVRARVMRSQQPPLRDDVLEFLKNTLRGNVRELEGALFSLFHFSRVAGQPITLELAREALADVLRHSIRLVQLADVGAAVTRVLGLEERSLQSQERGWMYSHPRMLAMHLARKHTGSTFSEIGQHFGGRNHSTAVAADKKVRVWLEENTLLKFGERQLRVRDLIERMERDLQR